MTGSEDITASTSRCPRPTITMAEPRQRTLTVAADAGDAGLGRARPVVLSACYRYMCAEVGCSQRGALLASSGQPAMRLVGSLWIEREAGHVGASAASRRGDCAVGPVG
jgi:hypothetical protein